MKKMVRSGEKGHFWSYRAETYPSTEQVTILQLHGSTELISQFSKTLYGSFSSIFMAINATTAFIEEQNQMPWPYGFHVPIVILVPRKK